MMPQNTTAPVFLFNARWANAIRASVPPSPLLSARSRMSTYFSVTTTINAQRMSESDAEHRLVRHGPSFPTAAVTASRKA